MMSKRYTKGSKIGTATIIGGGDPVRDAQLERDTGGESVGAEAYPRFDTQVRITVISYRVRFTDSDNCCSKYAIDAIVEAGILRDDSPKYVESVTHLQVKVRTKAEEETRLIIEEVA